MKVLIFGATGTVGLELVTQGLEMGHTVTAFARDPSKMAISHARLEIIEGDVLWIRRQSIGQWQVMMLS